MIDLFWRSLKLKFKKKKKDIINSQSLLIHILFKKINNNSPRPLLQAIIYLSFLFFKLLFFPSSSRPYSSNNKLELTSGE